MPKEAIMIRTMTEYGPEVNELSRLHSGFSQAYSQQTSRDGGSLLAVCLSIVPLMAAIKVPGDQGIRPNRGFVVRGLLHT